LALRRTTQSTWWDLIAIGSLSSAAAASPGRSPGLEETEARVDDGGEEDDEAEEGKPMPAAGSRRFTRVFMPKAPKPPQSQDQADPATRVLRSGKRLAADRIRWDAKEAAAFHVDINHGHVQKRQKEDFPKPGLPPLTKSFGIVYRRKRRRRRHPIAEVVPEDEDGIRRFGIVYTRKKGKRSKVSPLLLPQEPEAPCDLAAAIPCSSSREFASRTGFLDAHFSALVDGVSTHSGVQTLVVLVDTSCSGSSHRLLGFLLPVLWWMRHSRQRGKFQNLATFILSAGVAVAFASHGVHFVKLQSAVSFLQPSSALF
jgi:hypothetical protein